MLSNLHTKYRYSVSELVYKACPFYNYITVSWSGQGVIKDSVHFLIEPVDPI